RRDRGGSGRAAAAWPALGRRLRADRRRARPPGCARLPRVVGTTAARRRVRAPQRETRAALPRARRLDLQGRGRDMRGFLVLEDGTVFEGESVGATGRAFGEAVFTTSMTGYQEVLTDPSFAEQLVCFTAPMVGNYGVAPARSESKRP